MSSPTKVKVVDNVLYIKWNDGKEMNYPLKFLRDESPDAGNKGETILWKHYPPPPKGPDKPGKYEIKNIEIVGNYALGITWKDGFSDGIYSYELLRRLGEYLEVKENLHQDFEHEHNHESKDNNEKND